MQAAEAPVSLKGTREPLELFVAAAFLACARGAIPALIACLSLALGMHELRRVEAAARLGRWLAIGELCAWCACALFATRYFGPGARVPSMLAESLAWFSAVSALRILSQAPETASLTRYFSFLRWVALVPGLLALLLLTPLAHTMTVRELPNGLIIDVGPDLWLAFLVLRLRRATPRYGQQTGGQLS